MDEVALHFSAYYGFGKGEALQATADGAWARLLERPR
jgi:4-carboxymuconolactone decarboxylase